MKDYKFINKQTGEVLATIGDILRRVLSDYKHYRYFSLFDWRFYRWSIVKMCAVDLQLKLKDWWKLRVYRASNVWRRIMKKFQKKPVICPRCGCAAEKYPNGVYLCWICEDVVDINRKEVK